MKIRNSSGLGLIAFCAGILLTLSWLRERSALYAGEADTLIFIVLALGPIALIATYVVTRYVENAPEYKQLLIGFLYGAETGYILSAGGVLTEWYIHPENSHLEPLFVVYSTGIATIHWARRMWSSLDS